MTAQEIQRGRREAGRATHPRYYALNDHPNFYDFARRGDDPALFYTDDAGRQYRLGAIDADHGTRRVAVRLPRKDVPWFDLPDVRVSVQPRASGAPGETWTIVDTYLMARHRTGHVDIRWPPA
jgi:hypothetical protein